MPDYTRNFSFVLPVDEDSLALNQGIDVLNDWVDAVDTRLAAVAAMGADPTLGLGIWETDGTDQVFTSTATIANVTKTIVNKVYIGTANQYFTVSTAGTIDFNTEGLYRITIAPTIYYTSGWTEGQMSFGLKPSGVASYVTRCSHYMPIVTQSGATMGNKSFVIRAAATGGDVDLTTTYYVGFQQTNSSSGSVNYGDSGATVSWFAIEYLRPLT